MYEKVNLLLHAADRLGYHVCKTHYTPFCQRTEPQMSSKKTHCNNSDSESFLTFFLSISSPLLEHYVENTYYFPIHSSSSSLSDPVSVFLPR